MVTIKSSDDCLIRKFINEIFEWCKSSIKESRNYLEVGVNLLILEDG
jgi:hypothetical protein